MGALQRNALKRGCGCMSTLRHWLWLSTRAATPGMYSALLLERFGSPEAVYFAEDAAYDSFLDLPRKVKEALRDKDLTEADRILGDCERLGIRILTLQDAEYPERLRAIETAPCVLYMKGYLPRVDEEVAIGIVGARRATPYGIMAAGRLSLDLARQGAVIVSGSAWGIDSTALKGALKAGGKVISVLGNGIDVVYPAGNNDLYADIAATGALISEYPPGTPPLGEHFPVRNRILAGLCVGVLVVEGTERSGSLITARWALEQDREVFAVPGPIDAPMSKGPNRLISRSEARLVQDAWDILSEYELRYPAKLHPKRPFSPAVSKARLSETSAPLPKWRNRKKQEEQAVSQEPAGLVIDLNQDPEALTDDEAALLRALQGDLQLTADELVERTEIPARRILSALTMLQVRQLVTEETGKRFVTTVTLKE